MSEENVEVVRRLYELAPEAGAPYFDLIDPDVVIGDSAALWRVEGGRIREGTGYLTKEDALEAAGPRE